MKNSEAFKLIEGTFGISDVRSIVLRFYMRIAERKTHAIEQKILELNSTRKSIIQLLTLETDNNQQVEVERSIEIRFKDNNCG